MFNEKKRISYKTTPVAGKHALGTTPSRGTTPTGPAMPSLRRGGSDAKARCACGGGCPRCRPASSIPPALDIVARNDPRESAASQLARDVMQMRPPNPSTGVARPRSQSSPRGGGRSLPASELDFFGSRFDADLSPVRIHADPGAASLAAGLGARAFTLGQDIYFGTGEYRPGTGVGRGLLAHELAHTLQPQDAPPRVMRQPVDNTCDGPCPLQRDEKADELPSCVSRIFRRLPEIRAPQEEWKYGEYWLASVFFPTNVSDLSPDDTDVIEKVAGKLLWIATRPALRMRLRCVGWADPRGGAEYNEALSLERANTAAQAFGLLFEYLKSRLPRNVYDPDQPRLDEVVPLAGGIWPRPDDYACGRRVDLDVKIQSTREAPDEEEKEEAALRLRGKLPQVEALLAAEGDKQGAAQLVRQLQLRNIDLHDHYFTEVGAKAYVDNNRWGHDGLRPEDSPEVKRGWDRALWLDQNDPDIEELAKRMSRFYQELVRGEQKTLELLVRTRGDLNAKKLWSWYVEKTHSHGHLLYAGDAAEEQ